MSVREPSLDYLTGQYDAFRLLLTSPRMDRPQREVIEEQAHRVEEKLEDLGVNVPLPLGGGRRRRTRPTPGGHRMRRTELQRKTPLGRKANAAITSAKGTTLPRSSRPLKRGRGFAASPAQQKKARSEPCVVTGQETLYGATVDPAHLWPRSRGGCSHELCTVPLERGIHRLFDEGEFDLLPYLKGRLPELHHALDHADGDLCGLLHRLTGERPYERRVA